MKKCTKCLLKKDFICFNKNGSTGDKLANYCKVCCADLSRKRYIEKRDDIILNSSKNYIKNRRKKIETASIYQKKDGGLYKKYISIIERTNGKNIKYKNYTTMGIKCLWLSYSDFKKDMYESYLLHIDNHGKKDTTLDRVDVRGDYCKDNCRWATQIVQQNNKTNNVILKYINKTYTLSNFCREFKLNYRTTYSRIRRGWNVEMLLD